MSTGQMRSASFTLYKIEGSNPDLANVLADSKVMILMCHMTSTCNYPNTS